MRTRMKSQERKAAIVESAIQLFAEKGFRGTTTRELAAAVRVTEPVLYQHFRTKKELYSAIIEAESCSAEVDASGVLALAQADDDRAFFIAIGNLILSRFEADPKLLRLLLYSALERHELSDMFFDRVVSGFLKKVAGYIRRRARSGAFRPVNPDAAARALVGMFHYHGLVWMLHPGRFGKPNRRKLVHELVALFLDGIAAPPKG
jgi:AcrR family transcriptional regulator